MLKKIIATTLLGSSLLMAGNINLNLMDSFSTNTTWNISMSDNGTYYLMLPMDIDYSVLQNSISDENSAIYVYRWYQRSDLVNADFGVDVLGIVKITKNDIRYGIKDNGSWVIKSNYTDFKTYLEGIADNITDSKKKNIFINSYIPSFDKINANKLYLLMPKGMNLNLDIALPVTNTTGTNIEVPPQIPCVQ